MPSIPGYKKQCALFLRKQIEIVRPSAVVALGVKANAFVSLLDPPGLECRHPSDWHFRAMITRKERLTAQGESISQELLAHLQQS
jgi:uracil-DNA glycosylase